MMDSSLKNAHRKHMITKDGTEISIQRGRGIHSTPMIPFRTMVGEAVINPMVGPFDYPGYFDQKVDTVEVGLYSNNVLTEGHPMLRYLDDDVDYFGDEPDTDGLYVFHYVPLRVVDRLIKEHGGFDHIKED